MELSQLNNFNSMNQIESVQNNSIKTIDTNPSNNILSNDIVDIQESNINQKSFTSDIINNLNEISNLKQNQDTLNKQLTIVNEITTLTTQVIQTPQEGQVLDDIQPQIENLIDTFNAASLELENSAQDEISPSRTYFDGIVGSKPLSSAEIYEAVNQHKQRIEKTSQSIDDKVNQIVSDSKVSFEVEKKSVQQTTSNIDFTQQDFSQFNGSFTISQANGNIQNNLTLLSA